MVKYLKKSTFWVGRNSFFHLDDLTDEEIGVNNHIVLLTPTHRTFYRGGRWRRIRCHSSSFLARPRGMSI
jgi:hypothetical protein